ncbi:hypothetical protein PUN28_017414 [Cardiocondyla obscurior]|uniref:Uncharacterized protein n=1 Tax=Cardiocondyla obscurior TaxID=286306 RepID=A0AAW2EQM4_9HYME
MTARSRNREKIYSSVEQDVPLDPTRRSVLCFGPRKNASERQSYVPSAAQRVRRELLRGLLGHFRPPITIFFGRFR